MATTRHAIMVALAACSYPEPPDVCPDFPGLDPPALYAIHPSIASTGDTIMLEGTFLGPPTVRFGGSAEQRATLLSEHRASVVVPADAQTGDVVVKVAPDCTNRAAFRRAPGRPDLQTFRETALLRVPRAYATTYVVNDTVYVLGGVSPGGILNSIEHARINADCTLEAFKTDEMKLTMPRSDHATAVIGRSLYLFGGVTADKAASPQYETDTIERALIESDGKLGKFEHVDQHLDRTRFAHSTVVIGNTLYVLGGTSSLATGPAPDKPTETDALIERATIQRGGDLGPFSQVTPQIGILPASVDGNARIGPATAVIGDSVYILGGYYRRNNYDMSALLEVDKVSLSLDGGAFNNRVASFALNTERARPATVVVGSTLYAIGGFDLDSERPGASVFLKSTERALVVGGSLGMFHEFPPKLVMPRAGAATAIVGNCICALGGSNGDYMSSVECAALTAP